MVSIVAINELAITETIFSYDFSTIIRLLILIASEKSERLMTIVYP